MNENSIERLSKYKSSLQKLKTLGFLKVFSDNLADALGIQSAQVRKDFSLFGISGKKRGGYNVEDLLTSINTILGKDRIENVIIVGCGNIGIALMNYRGFVREKIKIIAGFDIDPSRMAKVEKIPIYTMEKLKDFIHAESVKIAIIAVPDIAAQRVADLLISYGIKGILNFAPIKLKSQGEVVINNVDLIQEIEKVIYYANAMDDDNGKES
ncbi:MAG: redox-sensing transcriptional repressor Rex [Spirochaetales bacterium]|nr:redox-sensing transcriptional repressor Rex [Spirochaetales bacterium]